MDFLNGWGTEISIGGWILFFIVKSGILKKIKVWIKIGGNGNDVTGKFKTSIVKNSGPGGGQCTKHATALATLQTEITNEKTSREKSDQINREEHKTFSEKIERVLIKLGA